ncbi:VOC family protein [Parahaliea mediterranea]|uniref:VOC family protein n=1 Tax=Parahaliea mediterranea TaxID=651086 RepID=A0A939DD53_9GAMM|nr:VOC family protein [Parahaliea mediterranea]MBN7795966.1 VOC family protein [Parahaliea mediterranea]
MNDAIRTQLDLGPMDQVGFVFRDVEAAMARYEPVFGPFSFHKFDRYEYNYRGRPEPCELWIAFARSGDLEIEFIQWVSGGSPHKEFLDAGREGMHHIRFRVPRLEDKVAAARALGYRSIWQTRFGEGLAVAYLEREDDPVLVELFEDLHDGKVIP